MDLSNQTSRSSTSEFGQGNRGDGKKWDLNSFEIGKRLGSGRFGSVYLAAESSTKFVVALKVLFKSEITESIEYQVKREVAIQFHLQYVIF
jgi:serine/threonine protein kinase